MTVFVPDSEDSKCFLEPLSQAAGFSTAPLDQQITGHLHVVVELWAEGPGSYSCAPPLTLRQEGELDCDIRVHSHTGIVAESSIMFRYNSDAKRQMHNVYLKTW